MTNDQRTMTLMGDETLLSHQILGGSRKHGFQFKFLGKTRDRFVTSNSTNFRI